jgi:hypothetical protein
MAIINRVTNVKTLLPFILAALSATAQTNLVNATNEAGISSPPAMHIFESPTNQTQAITESIQQVRAVCIQNRRFICGKILKILPEGMVVDSGYTNLLRTPINRSWLVPGTATASRAPHLIENNEPGAVCVGLVFLTDYPKSHRSPKPKLYDYVIIEGYPAGKYIYTSVGTIQRTVRRFSASISEAAKLNLQADKK